MKIVTLMLSVLTYLSFIWATLFFFKTGISGSKYGKRLVSVMGIISVSICLITLYQSTWEGEPLQWLELMILVTACILFWWTIITVIDNPFDFALSTNLPQRLISYGPYAYWRHPFYASYSFGWLSAVLITKSFWPLISFLTMGYFYYRPAIKEENQFLASELSEEYCKYRARVKILIPRVL